MVIFYQLSEVPLGLVLLGYSCLPSPQNTNKCLTQWLCPRNLSFDSPTISSHTAAVRSKEQEAKTCPNSGWAHVTRHTDPLCVCGIEKKKNRYSLFQGFFPKNLVYSYFINTGFIWGNRIWFYFYKRRKLINITCK